MDQLRTLALTRALRVRLRALGRRELPSRRPHRAGAPAPTTADGDPSRLTLVPPPAGEGADAVEAHLGWAATGEHRTDGSAAAAGSAANRAPAPVSADLGEAVRALKEWRSSLRDSLPERSPSKATSLDAADEASERTAEQLAKARERLTAAKGIQQQIVRVRNGIMDAQKRGRNHVMMLAKANANVKRAGIAVDAARLARDRLAAAVEAAYDGPEPGPALDRVRIGLERQSKFLDGMARLEDLLVRAAAVETGSTTALGVERLLQSALAAMAAAQPLPARAYQYVQWYPADTAPAATSHALASGAVVDDQVAHRPLRQEGIRKLVESHARRVAQEAVRERSSDAFHDEMLAAEEALAEQGPVHFREAGKAKASDYEFKSEGHVAAERKGALACGRALQAGYSSEVALALKAKVIEVELERQRLENRTAFEKGLLRMMPDPFSYEWAVLSDARCAPLPGALPAARVAAKSFSGPEAAWMAVSHLGWAARTATTDAATAAIEAQVEASKELARAMGAKDEAKVAEAQASLQQAEEASQAMSAALARLPLHAGRLAAALARYLASHGAPSAELPPLFGDISDSTLSHHDSVDVAMAARVASAHSMEPPPHKAKPDEADPEFTGNAQSSQPQEWQTSRFDLLEQSIAQGQRTKFSKGQFSLADALEYPAAEPVPSSWEAERIARAVRNSMARSFQGTGVRLSQRKRPGSKRAEAPREAEGTGPASAAATSSEAITTQAASVEAASPEPASTAPGPAAPADAKSGGVVAQATAEQGAEDELVPSLHDPEYRQRTQEKLQRRLNTFTALNSQQAVVAASTNPASMFLAKVPSAVLLRREAHLSKHELVASRLRTGVQKLGYGLRLTDVVDKWVSMRPGTRVSRYEMMPRVAPTPVEAMGGAPPFTTRTLRNDTSDRDTFPAQLATISRPQRTPSLAPLTTFERVGRKETTWLGDEARLEMRNISPPDTSAVPNLTLYREQNAKQHVLTTAEADGDVVVDDIAKHAERFGLGRRHFSTTAAARMAEEPGSHGAALQPPVASPVLTVPMSWTANAAEAGDADARPAAAVTPRAAVAPKFISAKAALKAADEAKESSRAEERESRASDIVKAHATAGRGITWSSTGPLRGLSNPAPALSVLAAGPELHQSRLASYMFDQRGRRHKLAANGMVSSDHTHRTRWFLGTSRQELEADGIGVPKTNKELANMALEQWALARTSGTPVARLAPDHTEVLPTKALDQGFYRLRRAPQVVLKSALRATLVTALYDSQVFLDEFVEQKMAGFDPVTALEPGGAAGLEPDAEFGEGRSAAQPDTEGPARPRGLASRLQQAAPAQADSDGSAREVSDSDGYRTVQEHSDSDGYRTVQEHSDSDGYRTVQEHSDLESDGYDEDVFRAQREQERIGQLERDTALAWRRVSQRKARLFGSAMPYLTPAPFEQIISAPVAGFAAGQPVTKHPEDEEQFQWEAAEALGVPEASPTVAQTYVRVGTVLDHTEAAQKGEEVGPPTLPQGAWPSAPSLLRPAPSSMRGFGQEAAPWMFPPTGSSAPALALWRVVHSVVEAGGPTFGPLKDSLGMRLTTSRAKPKKPASFRVRDSDADLQASRAQAAAHELVADAMRLTDNVLLSQSSFARDAMQLTTTPEETTHALSLLEAVWARTRAPSGNPADASSSIAFLASRAGGTAVIEAVRACAKTGDVVQAHKAIEKAWAKALPRSGSGSSKSATVPWWLPEAYEAVIFESDALGMHEQAVSTAEASLSAGVPLTSLAMERTLHSSATVASEGLAILDDHAGPEVAADALAAASISAEGSSPPASREHTAVDAADRMWRVAEAAELREVVPGVMPPKNRHRGPAVVPAGVRDPTGASETESLNLETVLKWGEGPFLEGVQVGGQGERARAAWARIMAGGALMRPLTLETLWPLARDLVFRRSDPLAEAATDSASDSVGDRSVLEQQVAEAFWSRGVLVRDESSGELREQTELPSAARADLLSTALVSLAAGGRAADVLATLRDVFGVCPGAIANAAMCLTGEEAVRVANSAAASKAGWTLLSAPLIGDPIDLEATPRNQDDPSPPPPKMELSPELAKTVFTALACCGQINAARSLAEDGVLGDVLGDEERALVFDHLCKLGELDTIHEYAKQRGAQGLPPLPQLAFAVREAAMNKVRSRPPVAKSTIDSQAQGIVARWAQRGSNKGKDVDPSDKWSVLKAHVRMSPASEEADSTWGRKARTGRPVSLAGMGPPPTGPTGGAGAGSSPPGLGARIGSGQGALGRGLDAMGGSLLGVLGLGVRDGVAVSSKTHASSTDVSAQDPAAPAPPTSAAPTPGRPADGRYHDEPLFAAAWRSGSTTSDSAARWRQPLFSRSSLTDEGVALAARSLLGADVAPLKAPPAAAANGAGARAAAGAAADAASAAATPPSALLSAAVQEAELLLRRGRPSSSVANIVPPVQSGHMAQARVFSQRSVHDAAVVSADLISLAVKTYMHNAEELANATTDEGRAAAMQGMDDSLEAMDLIADDWPIMPEAVRPSRRAESFRPMKRLLWLLARAEASCPAEAPGGADGQASATEDDPLAGVPEEALAEVGVTRPRREALVGCTPVWQLQPKTDSMHFPPGTGAPERMRLEHAGWIRSQRKSERATAAPTHTFPHAPMPCVFGSGRVPLQPAKEWAPSSFVPESGRVALGSGWFPIDGILFNAGKYEEKEFEPPHKARALLDRWQLLVIDEQITRRDAWTARKQHDVSSKIEQLEKALEPNSESDFDPFFAGFSDEEDEPVFDNDRGHNSDDEDFGSMARRGLEKLREETEEPDLEVQLEEAERLLAELDEQSLEQGKLAAYAELANEFAILGDDGDRLPRRHPRPRWSLPGTESGDESELEPEVEDENAARRRFLRSIGEQDLPLPEAAEYDQASAVADDAESILLFGEPLTATSKRRSEALERAKEEAVLAWSMPDGEEMQKLRRQLGSLQRGDRR